MLRWMMAGSALWALGTSDAHAQVAYTIDLTQKAEVQRGDVTATFSSVEGDMLDVKMPAWRTGRYTILDQANGVRQFSATSATGEPLDWRKIDKSTWRIDGAGGQPVTIRYEIYADQLGDRLRHIDDSHAYLNAAGIFMYADESRDERVTVSLDVPEGWQTYSGMERLGDHSFTAANYDIFADSPIESGISERITFEADGIDYSLVRWGGGNLDLEQVDDDLAAIGRASQEIWNGYPFEDFLYIIHATDGVGGATEYANSTIMQRPRWSFDGGGYTSFLTTAAHELIHAWNVKAYRAAGMNPYDYQAENYTDLLWLTEGSTSYFSYMMMLWADLRSVDQTLSTLSGQLTSSSRTPGVDVQSSAEASFDQWIGSPGDMGYNDSVSIYREGAIVSMLLDLALLDRTDGRVSYRDVHQRLWEDYQAGDSAFDTAEVKAILADLTGRDWSQWFEANVDTPLDADYAAALAPFGVEIAPSRGDPRPTAGWSASDGEGGMVLRAVPRGGPAWNAGFRPDDVIVAVDGMQANPQRLDAMIEERRIGETLTVTYFRRGRLAQKNLTLAAEPDSIRLRAVENPTARQARLFKRWMLRDHPND